MLRKIIKKKTAHLTNKETRRLKKNLKQEAKRIEKELRAFADQDIRPKGDFDTRFPQWGSHADENALEVSLYEKTLPIEHTLELRLKEINQALEKLKKGQYGLCQKCKKPITLARLEALPEAKTCLACLKKRQKNNF